MKRPNRLGGILITGGIAVFMGALGMYRAYSASLRHTMIPSRSGSMSPDQAFIGWALILGFGFVCLALWWQRRKPKGE